VPWSSWKCPSKPYSFCGSVFVRSIFFDIFFAFSFDIIVFRICWAFSRKDGSASRPRFAKMNLNTSTRR